jgi:hypothetical protein
MRHRRILHAAGCIATILGGSTVANAIVLFEQNFDSLTLGPIVTFGDSDNGGELLSRNAWTNVPPSGWSRDESLVPGDAINDGVREFRGWTFVDKNWWTQTAGDQNRSSFTLGYGVVAVADPDEFDDFSAGSGEGRGPAPDACVTGSTAVGCYEATFTTPAIPLTGVAPGAARLIFDSSWRPEDSMAGEVLVSFNGGAFAPIRTYASVQEDGTPDPDPSGDNTSWTKITDGVAQVGPILAQTALLNETVDIPVNNPAGATSMQVRWRMLDAGNDWWWATDNIQVYAGTPGLRDPVLKVVVDRNTGEVSIVNGTSQPVSLRGYQILSADGAFNADAATFLSESNSSWVRLSESGAGSDLSEGHATSFVIASGASVSLGAGAWADYYRSEGDVGFKYLVSGRTDPVPGRVEFTGQEFAFLDLNFDGQVNIQDWVAFRSITTQADLSGLTIAQAYRRGDLNRDLRVGVTDFVAFQREYDRLFGGGAFATAVAKLVPEPNSSALFVFFAFAAARRHRVAI